MRNRKQLFVLLLVATWISIAVFWYGWLRGIPWYGWGAWASGLHDPIRVLSKSVIVSVPAIIFGAIAFWWFGKEITSKAGQ